MIVSKLYAHLQPMTLTPVKFQSNQHKTVDHNLNTCKFQSNQIKL